ncbi:MAG: hypothetical protein RL081_1754, partial [Pseudomonadota bacterium]
MPDSSSSAANALLKFRHGCYRAQFLAVEHAKHRGQQRHDDQHEQNELAQPSVQKRPDPPGQQPAQGPGPLHRQTGVRLADIAT